MRIVNRSIIWTKSLRGQMMLSYVSVTLVSIFVAEIVIFGAFIIFLIGENSLPKRIKRTAEVYAEQLQPYFREDGAFNGPFPLGNPRAAIIPDQITFDASGIVIPHIEGNGSSETQRISLALVISPDKRILASSYPGTYSVGADVADLLPNIDLLLENVAMGDFTVQEFTREENRYLQTAVPIFLDTKPAPVGFVYIHVPNLPTGINLLVGILVPLLGIALLLTIVILPIGVIFGLFSTRGVVSRLNKLTAVTDRFAKGDFSQRILIQREDELGELEHQFNTMAGRIVESIEREKELITEQVAAGERERISMELHDSLSQDMFSLNMLVSGLQQALPAEHSFQTQMQLLQTTIDHMIREMRALIIAMRPALLESNSLSEALCTFINQYRRFGIDIALEMDAQLRLDQKLENVLFRISQEAISNAVRHADANEIKVSLQQYNGYVQLSIQDDGKGFELDNASQGFGLQTMHQRITALQGQVDISSSPQTGTRVTVTIPHDRNRKQNACSYCR
jgi:signal transduction histidine kinase